MSDEFKIYVSLSDGMTQPVLFYKGEYRDITPNMANYITLLRKKVEALDIIIAEDLYRGENGNRGDSYMFDILENTWVEFYKEKDDES